MQIRIKNPALMATVLLSASALATPAFAVEEAKPAPAKPAAKVVKKKAAPAPVAPAPVKPAASWWDGVTFDGFVNASSMFNTKKDTNNMNFGRFMDDKDGVTFNRIQLNLGRAIDVTSKDYDVGFKVQALYGSDARYTRALDFLDKTMGDSRNQVDVAEANVLVHTPWFTDGGFDLRIGKYYDMESAETLDPTGNFFYSHSYIFLFGDPYNHTGVMTTLHATPWLDLYLGVSTGMNTTGFHGDNNDAVSFQGAIGLNLGEVTSTLTTHIGPETADAAVRNGLVNARIDADESIRALSTWTTVWKYSDTITLTTDLNWIFDENLNNGKRADGFGWAQYGTYKINDVYSVGVRGELWRDVEGVYVCQFAANQDYIRSFEGVAARSARSVCGGKTTYGSLTAGLNISPDLGKSVFKGLTFRPEVRYDSSLNDTRPFNDSRDRSQFTFGGDMILKF